LITASLITSFRAVVIAASSADINKASPWSTQANAIKAGKAVTFCLQQYLWGNEPALEKIEVIVWSQIKDTTGNSNIYVGATLTQSSAASFDWNQTPEQAWNKYDEKDITNNM